MRSYCLVLILLFMPVDLVVAETPSFQALRLAGQDTGKPRPRAIIETGAQAGYAFGVEGPTFSTFRAVTEIGVLFDKTPDGRRADRAFGVTLYTAMGYDDFRIGVKPRLRYQFAPNWSADFSAGALLASLESHPAVSSFGFVGGISLNYSSWLTIKSDVNVVKIDERPIFQQGQQVGVEEAGYEIAVYTGAALRNRAGVYAAVTGAAVFLAYAIIYMAETGGT
jgi:hypothetical protein